MDSSFFKDHEKIAQEKATANTIEFLNELAKKVEQIEKSKQAPQDKIESAQSHPDFSAMLHKAIIASAQTENKDKHIILARIVSERLKSEPESILALASKMACEAISYATVNQLMILGLAVNFYAIRPNLYPSDVNETNFQIWFDDWLVRRIKPYQDITFRKIDIIHLESLACLKLNAFIIREINNIFKKDDLSYDFRKMKDVQLKDAMETIWKDGLQSIELTTVGQIIGVSVSDLLTNTNTIFDGWDEK